MIISASPGVVSEIESVKHEIRRVAAGISNPLLRRGFERGMEMALKEVSSGFLDQSQSVQSVSDYSVSSLVGLFCFSQSVEDYFRVS
jgi:hypothetical protein